MAHPGGVQFLQPLPEIVRPLVSRSYRLTGHLDWTVGGVAFRCPQEYVTDLASTPGVLRWLIPPEGRYEAPCIAHDFCCEDLGRRFREGRPLSGPGPDAPLADSRGVDRLVFRAGMAAVGVGPCTRHLMWTAVRWGALRSGGRRKGWWRGADPWVVLGTSLVALPFLVVGVAVVGLLAGLLRLADLVLPAG